MLKVCSFLTLLSFVLCHKCDLETSIDISKGIRENDSIRHDGIIYEKNEHFFDNKTKTERGCVCLKRKCVLKCCPFGEGYSWMEDRICVNTTHEFNPAIMDMNMRDQGKATDLFHFNFRKPNCDETEVRIMIGEVYDVYNMRPDGKLYIEIPTAIPPWLALGPDKYCIDTFVREDEHGNTIANINALVCFKEQGDEEHYDISSSCMLISCVFIIATVGVYCWLPELRNLHGRVLIAYLLCLFVGFLFLSTMQILLMLKKTITVNVCVVLTFFIYFSLLSAFFWLNVMCFDIWWTFSGKRGLSIEKMSVRARFLAYSLYAFGCPTALTTLLAVLEFSGLPKHPLLPLLKEQGCFLYGLSKLIYFYGPIIVLYAVNLIFFLLTAIKIAKIKKETSVLKSNESATHDNQNKNKQRLFLYAKLFVVMGINWILEVISYFYPNSEIWKYIDAYNVLIGLIIFILFVCKKKIFRLLKKRYKQYRGQPISRSQTTSSRASTRDEIALTSIKN